MNISKNQFKLITSLSQKKYRQKHKLFVAEGIKVVREMLSSSLKLNMLFCVDDVFFDVPETQKILISEKDLKKISNLKSPNKVLGIFHIPDETVLEYNALSVALDGINDPGNLGTIIRLCDWFGVQQLICSKDTVDCYNSKVVQASMGSLTRVSIHYVDLVDFVKKTNTPIFIGDMDGENVYKSKLPKEAILLMGNEANGVSSEVKKEVSHKIAIPRSGKTQVTESLNVATATAILLSEFKRGI